MTITLTREEAQQVLDALNSCDETWVYDGEDEQIVDQYDHKLVAKAKELFNAKIAQPEERLLTEAQALDIAQKLADCAVLGSVPPSGTTWQNAALRLGEELSTVGPDGYYNMTARQWLDWAMKNVTPARLTQPEPKPVAWTVGGLITDFSRDFSAYKTKAYTRPLYTAPPQREWQGLTGEELQEIYQGAGTVHFKFAMVEAKLKEKNS
jgi:hypothetical protein